MFIVSIVSTGIAHEIQINRFGKATQVSIYYEFTSNIESVYL